MITGFIGQLYAFCHQGIEFIKNRLIVLYDLIFTI